MKPFIIASAAILLAAIVWFAVPRHSETSVTIARSDTGKSVTCDGTNPDQVHAKLHRLFKGIAPGDVFSVSVVPYDKDRGSFSVDVEVHSDGTVSRDFKDASGKSIDGGVSRGSSSGGRRDFVTSDIWAKVCYEFLSDEEKAVGKKAMGEIVELQIEGEPIGEQGGARRPATAADSKSEGNEKSKPEAEDRSQ